MSQRGIALIAATTAVVLGALVTAGVLIGRQTMRAEALAPVPVSASSSTSSSSTRDPIPTQAAQPVTPSPVTSQGHTAAPTTPIPNPTDAADDTPQPTAPTLPVRETPANAPSKTRPACPTGTLAIQDLVVSGTATDTVAATGKLVNTSNANILAGSNDTPMIYGLNDAGKWVTLIHTGSLTPDWDTGPVSPQNFVMKPGASATFKITNFAFRIAEVKKWYATPPVTYWNDPVHYANCAFPGAGFTDPAYG